MADVLQAPWEPHTDIFISCHCLSTEGRPRHAPPLAPASCFSQPFPRPPAWTAAPCPKCCSPCPLHRASSHISWSHSSSNPPSEAAFAKGTVTIEYNYFCVWRVTLKLHLLSDEGPSDLTVISVPLLLLFLSFIGLLASLEPVLIPNPSASLL